MAFLHVFGPRFVLPVPLVLYLFAAGFALVAAFLLLTALTGGTNGEPGYPRWEQPWLAAARRSSIPRVVGGGLGLLGLALVLAGGFRLWVYFWVGLLALVPLAGNLWPLLNPWTAIDSALSRLSDPAPNRPLPAWLGCWPACLLYLAFAYLGLTFGMGGSAWLVAAALLAYSVLTVLALRLSGRDWLAHGEVFSVLSDLVSRFGPVEFEGGRAHLRPWGFGLLRSAATGWDRVIFIILLLGATAFDCVLATPLWAELVQAAQPLWLPFGLLGFFLLRAAALILLTLLFLTSFVAVMRLAAALGGGRGPSFELTTAFAIVLVPIALVLNAAHNYTYLFVAPPAVGWWLTVALVVGGHLLALYLAHGRARQFFRGARAALASQYPLLALLVVSAMTSLWVLAQPITR